MIGTDHSYQAIIYSQGVSERASGCDKSTQSMPNSLEQKFMEASGIYNLCEGVNTANASITMSKLV